MAKESLSLKTPSEGRNTIRLRTLVALRWWAIAGQLGALLVAQYFLDLKLDLGLCYSVIGLTIITNVFATFVFPVNRRLAEKEILLIVVFDMFQLSLLLYLTGGLNNPFSIMILGPVTVSASALGTRSTIFVAVTAMIIASLLTQFFLPLTLSSGETLSVPSIFLFGNWIAIIVTVAFLGAYSRWIVSEIDSMSEALRATQMALAREQKLTDLGGVVAAAAHELGTPLATIKLTSSELALELSDQEELREDALLIKDQADRCRDILRSMGRIGKDDLHMRYAPLTAVIEEAAEPHLERGKSIIFDIAADHLIDGPQPVILRQPEVIHGLRNLVQNAVDFSKSRVWIESDWTEKVVKVRVMDDGAGYPPQLLGRIGEPFMRKRSQPPDPRRPEYEGMGLGLFIAKTLLERSGADLIFANGAESFDSIDHDIGPTGAVVEVTWPREHLEERKASARLSLGANKKIEV